MPPDEANDLLIQKNLEALGIALLIQWDTLAFLYRHGTALVRAGQIVRLLGSDTSSVSKALDRLESQGLIERSRGSQGIHLYRFAVPTDPLRQSSFIELIGLAETRTGRLLLLKFLGRGIAQTVGRSRGLRLE